MTGVQTCALPISEHLGLLAFKEYVEDNLGDRYEVQIFPNEILGAAQRAIELTQTGAIDFVVAGTANLETFASVYEIFSMPYLFDSVEAYHETMMVFIGTLWCQDGRVYI